VGESPVRNSNNSAFKPGQSGNPGGRAKGLERIFREELKAIRHASTTATAENPDAAVEYLDGYRAAFRRLWNIAMLGEDKDSLVALKLLFERTFGMPKQKISITEDDDAEAVNWALIPIDERKKLFATLSLVVPSDDTTEH